MIVLNKKMFFSSYCTITLNSKSWRSDEKRHLNLCRLQTRIILATYVYGNILTFVHRVDGVISLQEKTFGVWKGHAS